MLYSDLTSVVGATKRAKKKQQQQQLSLRPSDGYIEKYDFRGQPTVVVKDFEPEVFKQLVNYTHTGSVVLQARTLLGLMNASDHYALEELKQACIRFMEHCITIDSVCSLLSSAEKYIQYKSTKILVQKIFEFVDTNAERILPLRSFLTLPQHVVRIVLSREDLRATELTKFEAAYNWCLSNSEETEREGGEEDGTEEIKKLFEPFVDVIDYLKIPAKHLMQRVKPSGVVDDAHILTALAYQADPTSIPSSSARSPSGGGRLRKIMTPLATGPGGVASKPPTSSKFRRVQSSGVAPMEKLLSLQRRSSENAIISRDARGGSVPLNSDLPEDCTSLDVTDGYMYPRGSEIHPLRARGEVKARMDSQSSISHMSVLSSSTTPPTSPAHSPSTTSYQGSILSGSSSDSILLLGEGGGVVSSSSSGTSKGGSGSSLHSQASAGAGASGVGGGVATRGLSYNPQALDAIVNLSSSNVVEV